MIFTSRRANSTGGLVYEMDGHFFEDIYSSNKLPNNTWGEGKQLDLTINSVNHDACVGLSSEGQTMIIYKDDGGGDLYYSQLSGSTWSKPISFGKSINTDAREACGNFSPDGNYLFFVSDKKGGFGGTDIYWSKKNTDGAWAAPVNMGKEVNTAEDEFSPYLNADGKTFYFSSQAHNSMGGFDIFQSIIDLSIAPLISVSTPTNLGYPINTVGDEIYFVWSADNKRAYFSSAREGGFGDKDLYLLERPEARAALVLLKGTISDCKSKQFIQANISVTDIESGKSIGKYVSNSSTGKYIVTLPAGKNYAINAEAKGYLFHSKNINIPKLENFKEIDDVICLDKIDIGSKIVLNNVFFDVNKATLRKESEIELDKLFDILSKNPKIKIEVAGHTDSDGDTQANLTLSDGRAHAVMDYLIAKGISADRIIYIGHGEDKPVVANDTPENKQLNRRTEIKILAY
jgi:outer membrane protein OmpA-like peptidoglycan-associated protein